MAITLTGAQGFWTRFGVISRLIRTLNGARGNTAANPGSSWGGSTKTIFDLQTAVQNIFAQYTSQETALMGVLPSVQASLISSIGSQNQQLAQLAQDSIKAMAERDSPRPDASLSTALQLLITQMTGTSDSIKKPTVTATPAAGGSNVGTWKLTSSVLNKYGVQNDYIIPETMTATVTNDAQHTATAGSEPITIQAPVATDTGALDWNAPSYSGVSQSINITDPTLDNQQNMLTNSDFETYTVANTPDNWPVITGIIGTDIKKTLNPLLGSAALEFVGDAATNTQIAQPFATSPGTAAELEVNTVYAVGVWTKVSAVPAAGVLKVCLIDNTNTIMNDDAGTANSFTISLPGESDSAFGFHSGYFRTPKTFAGNAAIQKISLQLSTALSIGSSVYVDGLAMTPATQMYPGGPYIASFRGDVDPLLNDLYTVALANNWATVAIFALMAQQCFDLRSLGLLIPSAGGNTINENLIS